MAQLSDDCFAFGGSLLGIEAARRMIVERGTPVAGVVARIFSGALLPEGADVVIMQEYCERDGGRVTIRPGIKRGANTRKAGEDVARGSIALTAGVGAALD